MKNLIFGAGFFGRYAYHLLKLRGVRIDCFVVSDKRSNPKSVFGIHVDSLDDLADEKEEVCIYIGVDIDKRDAVVNYIVNHNYNKYILIDFPRLIISSFPGMGEKQFLSMWYEIHKGNAVPWDNPITFNEKIQWIKLYGVTSLMRDLTDKWRVRDWIERKIGKEYLVPIYGMWDRFDDIDFTVLPSRYVLKCNHGCGYNYIVKDSADLDMTDARIRFTKWLHTDYGYDGGLELQYHGIQPHIIAEEYMENTDGDLYDYKFWCFQGKVNFIMYLCERSHGLKMNNYDLNWNLLPFTYNYPNTDFEVKKPSNLREMIRIAELLSQGFNFVRVDLYQLNDGSIKFGEMTFTPYSGICDWSDENINIQLGHKISLMDE